MVTHAFVLEDIVKPCNAAYWHCFRKRFSIGRKGAQPLYHYHSLKTQCMLRACLSLLCYNLAAADVLPQFLEIHVKFVE
jgi:hypothetical protein